jgi:hypothetical protein
VPRLSRWFIRTGLVFLLISLMVGISHAVLGTPPAGLWPTYVHLLVLGWITQLIFGVAYWMFPKPLETTRWSEPLGWATYWLLNLGLVFRVAGELGQSEAGRNEIVLALAGAMQLAAGCFFVLTTWPRVRGR